MPLFVLITQFLIAYNKEMNLVFVESVNLDICHLIVKLIAIMVTISQIIFVNIAIIVLNVVHNIYNIPIR